MNDLMIDIETLGTKPGSVIASIGAVEFDAISGEFGRELYVIVDVADAQAAGLTIDASTVGWWMKQSDEARTKTFSTGQPLNLALVDLKFFVQNVEPARIWAHSPSFDLVLLEAAYRATHIMCPWGHRPSRDTRTLYDLARVKIQTAGVHHDALDDAKAQATAVIEAYRALGLSNLPLEANVPPIELHGIAAAPDDEQEACIVCEEPLEDGDLVYWDVNDTGHMHAACCGPERESYVNADGEPLKDGEPIPEPFKWRPDR